MAISIIRYAGLNKKAAMATTTPCPLLLLFFCEEIPLTTTTTTTAKGMKIQTLLSYMNSRVCQLSSSSSHS